MTTYKTEFSREKAKASLRANNDRNLVHRKAYSARNLLKAVVPEPESSGLEHLTDFFWGLLSPIIGVRPLIYPGIATAFEALKCAKLELEESWNSLGMGYPRFDSVDIRFNWPIIVGSYGEFNVSVEEWNKCSVSADVAYNPREDASAVQTILEYSGKPFEERVSSETLAPFIAWLNEEPKQDSKARKIMVGTGFSTPNLSSYNIKSSVGGGLIILPTETVLYQITALLVGSLNHYKELKGETYRTKSVFLYNSQKAILNLNPVIRGRTVFVTEVLRRDNEAGYFYTATSTIFSGETPVVYGKGAALELLL